MKMHRIFIAINLPETIKKKLIIEQREIKKKFAAISEEVLIDPVRWTKKDNLHITLVFIGNANDQEIVEICKLAKIAVQKNESFFLRLNRICLGPPNPKPEQARFRAGKTPRMVWVEGEKNKELGKLKVGLEQILLNSENTQFNTLENRAFSPHITLGRIKQWQWKQIDPEIMPGIEKEISLSFDVNSIEIMESTLKRTGPEYIVLESINLEKL